MKKKGKAKGMAKGGIVEKDKKKKKKGYAAGGVVSKKGVIKGPYS
tara:strand:+ start:134 stop:268 length:135 start_codon:yes stop_codon:yes gene_type:complete